MDMEPIGRAMSRGDFRIEFSTVSTDEPRWQDASPEEQATLRDFAANEAAIAKRVHAAVYLWLMDNDYIARPDDPMEAEDAEEDDFGWDEDEDEEDDEEDEETEDSAALYETDPVEGPSAMSPAAVPNHPLLKCYGFDRLVVGPDWFALIGNSEWEPEHGFSATVDKVGEISFGTADEF